MSDLASRLAARCAADGEFRLAARYWTGHLVLDLERERIALEIHDGSPSATDASAAKLPVGANIGIRGPAVTWERLLAPVPPPFFNDIMSALGAGLQREGDIETFWQYYPAVRRAVELLREEVAAP